MRKTKIRETKRGGGDPTIAAAGPQRGNDDFKTLCALSSLKFHAEIKNFEHEFCWKIYLWLCTSTADRFFNDTRCHIDSRIPCYLNHDQGEISVIYSDPLICVLATQIEHANFFVAFEPGATSILCEDGITFWLISDFVEIIITSGLLLGMHIHRRKVFQWY